MALCTSCGTDNPERAKFCLECGTALPGAGEGRGVRKLVTVLFADVVGSTALGEQLEPEAMRTTLALYFTAARTVLGRHGGTVEKFIGDAVMAVFGVPLLHEDDALRAVRAALELRDEIGRINDQLWAERGLRVEFRIGVNSGMVVAGGEGSGSFVTGDAVNVAARLEQAAGAGEVFIGDATYRLVRDYVEAEAVGPVTAKGKSEAVRAYRLSGLVGGAGAAVTSVEGQSSFVGRRRELSRVGEAFDDAAAERRCFLFTVLGSAGVGKSRLVAEFLANHADAAAILRGRCLPYGEGITYWPVAEIVRAATGAVEGDDAATLGKRITDTIVGDPNAPRVADLLVSMLGLSTTNAPAEERSWAIRRFLEAVARDRPLICLIEDIHWADPELLDLLENVADWTRDVSILLLCTARQELLEARPTWGAGKVNVTSTLLEPLNADMSRELIASLVTGTALAPALIERIVATSEGNPLFAEELVRMVADDEASREGADAVQIPTSVQAVIAARLDRLPRHERLVAERASVAGRVFERGAILDLVGDDERERVPGALLALIRKEVVQPSQPDLTADEAFRFRHVLIRDTAYESLPKAERAELHERFAGWVERVVAERIDEYAEIVAYHLELAARFRRDLGLDDERSANLADRAGKLLRGAGERAYLRGEEQAAVKLLERAIGLLPAGAARRDALVTLARAAAGYSWATSVRASTQLGDEARASGDEAGALIAELLTFKPQSFTDPSYTPSASLPRATEAIKFFGHRGDELGLALAEEVLAIIYLELANWDLSRAAAERALPHALAAGDGAMVDGLRFQVATAALWGMTPVAEFISLCDAQVAAVGSRSVAGRVISCRALGHAMAGNAEAARSDIAEALAIERDLGDPSLAWQSTAPYVEVVLGDFEAALASVDHNLSVLERLGETNQRSTQIGLRARLLFDLGRPDADVIADVDECRRLAAADDTVSQLLWRAVLALVDARAGRHDDARRWIDEATRVMTKPNSDSFYEVAATAADRAYVHTQAGEVEAAHDEYERALALFEQKGDVMDAAHIRTKMAALRIAGRKTARGSLGL